MAKSFAALLALAVAVGANPVEKRQSQVSAATISSYTPFTNYAGAAYCLPSSTSSWSCGSYCNANPTFNPVASGGDGGSVQYWYVGYDPTLQTVIVAYQGTDTSKIQALVSDADAILTTLDPSMFPGMSSSIEVHEGFASAHAASAANVLAAVNTALSSYGVSKITVVGHSLGSAIALIQSVYLTLQLPSVTVVTYGYSMPRVGNQAFADWVDSYLTVTHITNKKDPIPICPGRFLGYVHPSGEVHIASSDGVWYSCPGQDNTSTLCTVGDVPNIFDGNTSDHDGPFNGIQIGTSVANC